MKKYLIILLILILNSFLISQEIVVQKKVESIQAPVLADFENPENTKLWKIGKTSPNWTLEFSSSSRA